MVPVAPPKHVGGNLASGRIDLVRSLEALDLCPKTERTQSSHDSELTTRERPLRWTNHHQGLAATDMVANQTGPDLGRSRPNTQLRLLATKQRWNFKNMK